MNEHIRAFVRSIFGDPPPRDRVNGTGLTREDLRRSNDATGKPFRVFRPGNFVEDADGMPAYMTEGTYDEGTFGGCIITESDAERLNWTEEEFPNIRVMKDPLPRATEKETEGN